MTQWLPGMRITADRLNDGLDAVETTTGLAAAAGFSVIDFHGARSGKTVVLDMYLQRTGADIPVSAQGNFSPDVPACTTPPGWRPTNGTINANWDDGVAEGGFVIGTDGICTLRTTNGEAITTGRNLRLHVGFILGA